MGWACGKNERKKIDNDSRCPESGDREDRECNWRTELGEVCKEWEENGEQKIEEIGDC